MKISSIKQFLARRGPRSRRAVFAAVLLALTLLVGSALAAGNLLANGSFEKDGNGDGEPNNWTTFAGAGKLPKRNCNQSYAGDCSLKFTLDNQYKNVRSDNIVIPGGPGSAYTLTVWLKTKDLVLGVSPMQVQLHFHYPSNNTTGHSSVFVPAGTHDWQVFYTTPYSGLAFDYLYVEFVSDQDGGKVWFDKMKVEQGCDPSGC